MPNPFSLPVHVTSVVVQYKTDFKKWSKISVNIQFSKFVHQHCCYFLRNAVFFNALLACFKKGWYVFLLFAKTKRSHSSVKSEFETHSSSSQFDTVNKCISSHTLLLTEDRFFSLYVYSSTSVSSPGETMPRSDSADSQSQAIQEEPLPSTSNDDEDPLAGKINCYPTFSCFRF